MKGLIKLGGVAFLISFLGSLPLGTLNLSVANYAFQRDWPGAIGFSVAAIAVEVALVRVALVAIRRLEGLTYFFRVFHVVTCGVLLFLAYGALSAAWKMTGFRVSLISGVGINPWASGFLLSLTNPLHLPFWMGWVAVLRMKGILGNGLAYRNVFVAGIGFGTFLAFCAYGVAGGYLIGLLGSRQVLLNWGIGFALLITAGLQLYKAFFKKTAPVAA